MQGLPWGSDSDPERNENNGFNETSTRERTSPKYDEQPISEGCLFIYAPD